MLRSSASLMKSGSRIKPGTRVCLMVKGCFDSFSSPDQGANELSSGFGRLLMGLKKSLMALRF